MKQKIFLLLFLSTAISKTLAGSQSDSDPDVTLLNQSLLTEKDGELTADPSVIEDVHCEYLNAESNDDQTDIELQTKNPEDSPNLSWKSVIEMFREGKDKIQSLSDIINNLWKNRGLDGGKYQKLLEVYLCYCLIPTHSQKTPDDNFKTLTAWVIEIEKLKDSREALSFYFKAQEKFKEDKKIRKGGHRYNPIEKDCILNLLYFKKEQLAGDFFLNITQFSCYLDLFLLVQDVQSMESYL